MGKITVKHYLNKQLKPEKEGKYLHYPLYVSISVNRKFVKKRSNVWQYISEKEFDKNFPNLPDVKQKTAYESNLFSRIVKLFIHDYDNHNVNNKLLYFFSSKGYKSKDNFINLLTAYIDYYSFSIYTAIYNYCNKEIENEVFNKLAISFNLTSPIEVKKIFKTPREEAEFIIENLSDKSIELLALRERLRSFLSPYNLKTGYDIPLIDWFDKLIQDDLREFLKNRPRKTEYYLKEGFVFNEIMINKFIEIIDEIVHSPNYFDIAKYDIE